MSSPSAPPPAPDPVATANAQTASNKATAITQFGLNAVNQNTPQGTSSYKQIGTWADGTPRFEQSTALNPQEQGIYDLGAATRANVGQIGVNQSQKIGDILNTPVDLNNAATEGRLMELGLSRLDPALQRSWNDRESTLLNRGVVPGSEAYGREQDAFNRSRNDAYNQLLLSGRGQAVQEALTQRNQPINEITALLSGSQVSQPNFSGVNIPQEQVAPTDVAGITQNAYQNSLIPWQAKNQYNQAFMGGLFGLGSAALGGWGRAGFSMGR